MSVGENMKGQILNIKGVHEDDLKRIIALQRKDILDKNKRLKGVEKLTNIVNELEESRQSLQSKADNFESALRRAEARIAYLNKKLGIGPQTSMGVEVVDPGVSRKEYDALMRDNIRLKESLEHIVATELGGQDVVTKNHELYELVTTLQHNLDQYKHHIRELESILASRKDTHVDKINELTKLTMHQERSIQAKQVFSEKLLSENKWLKEALSRQQVKHQVLDQSSDVPDGQVPTMEKPTIKPRNSITNKEREALMKEIDKRDEQIVELKTKSEEVISKEEVSSKQISDLTAEIAQANERNQKVEKELSDTLKKCSDFQKKCAGFFNQVVSLNSKQQESEEEISSLKRSQEHLRAMLAEKGAMAVMMQDSLKTYEDDFKRENEEKASIQKRLETAKLENERLKRENQSNMATLRHFEAENERLSKQLIEERNKNKGGFSSGFSNSIFGPSASKSLFQDHSTPIVVADGAGLNESSPGTRQGNQSNSAPTLIECPYCSRSYPCHLIEGHVQDCMEESLYLDD